MPVLASLDGPACRDPDDDVVLATALGAEATLIVSGDSDLLALGAYQRVRILGAIAAVAFIGG